MVECDVPFSLLEPHTCHVNTDDAENEPTIPSSSKSHALSNSSAAATAAVPSSTAAATITTSTKRKSKEEKRQQKDREKRAKKEALLEDEDMPINNRVKEELKNENSLVEKKTNGTSTTSSLEAASQAVARDMDEEMTEVQTNSTEIRPEDVVILQGHQSEVFSCAWNPVVSSLLASG